eukprot:EST46017.1 UDP-N-acetylglucosamine-dolichyl-phosphate N-acetylglucosaminephosphotransferase [Spironucleus salmonicida]
MSQYWTAIAQLMLLPLCSALFTLYTLPKFLPLLLQKNLGGFDLNKPREHQTEKTPEAAGIVLLISFCIFSAPLNSHLRVSLISAGLLGFVDNVLDLKWRWKIIIPLFQLIELGMYHIGLGCIELELPFMNLKLSYLSPFLVIIYSIISQNLVNIYAGINGLEIGQSIVAQVFLFTYVTIRDGFSSILSLNLDFAILTALFVSGSFVLYQYNKYPAKAFVGDVYTYFAGSCYVASAVSGRAVVLSIFLYFMQIINCGASLPQLLKIVPCPRHRLLELRKDGKLYGQKCNWNNINQFSLKVFRRGLFEYQLFNYLMIIQIFVSLIVVFVALYV